METRVAKIISETCVVLAAGSNQGVREGMRFVIFESCDEILDPETKESLGNLEIVKGRVRVKHVMPNMCQAETDFRIETRYRDSNPLAAYAGALASVQSMLYQPQPYQVQVGEKLKIDPKDRDERYLTPDKTVRVGDRARALETDGSNS